ncbi:hypothetical protein RB195_016476 [Necator americanus]|uniref:Uncharacterized protein n=1 Tax=Necator americanus TaxID=51031 RepID=A0ABR1C4D0_NECAM
MLTSVHYPTSCVPYAERPSKVRELAQHAHQQDSDEFVVETVAFQNVDDYQVTERIDAVTVEHCLTHLGHEMRVDANSESDGIQLYRPAQNPSGDGFDNMRLARRPDVPPVRRPQAPTPIRKLQKRAHLRKEEQAKRRGPLLDIPDCTQDEKDTCTVCLQIRGVMPLKVMRNPTEGTRMGLEQAESMLKEFRKMIDDLAGNVEESENNVRLARRPEVPPVGRSQTLTLIRKLHKV